MRLREHLLRLPTQRENRLEVDIAKAWEREGA